MKITIHRNFNQIIKEEISKAVNEAPPRRRLRPLRPVASATQPKTSIPATQAPAAAPAKPAAPAPKTFSTGDSKLDAWIEKNSGGPHGGVNVLGFEAGAGKKSMRIKDNRQGVFVIMPKGIKIMDLSGGGGEWAANPADVLGAINAVGNGSVTGVKAVPVGLSDPGEFMVAPSEDLKKPVMG